MSETTDQDEASYYKAADSWAADRDASQRSITRIAWIVAGAASLIAIAEAIALVVLLPLKTVVPYALLVDRQTGYVETLKPLDKQIIAPDRALTRSLLAQYIVAREGFDIDSLKEDYRKVALWSAGGARNQYIASMQASNPASPLATLPRRAIIGVEIKGISSLSPDTALVRFATMRTDGEGRPQISQSWQAVIAYRFSVQSMSVADRLINPIGFQVTRYNRNAETPPSQESPARAQAYPAPPANSSGQPQ